MGTVFVNKFTLGSPQNMADREKNKRRKFVQIVQRLITVYHAFGDIYDAMAELLSWT